MSNIESRMKELGIELPSPSVPAASYVPFVITGNLVFVAGQIPIFNGAVQFVGKLGLNVSKEEGQAAARLCALNILAQMKVACEGNLERVRRCVKLGVFVNATPEFTEHPAVANGASDLLVSVLGPAGKHARAATGAVSLPRGVAVEADAVFEIG